MFTHKPWDTGGYQVQVKENKGLQVSFYFGYDDEFASTVEIELTELATDQIEMDSLYVGIGNEIISLKALAVKAAMYVAELRGEDAKDAAEHENHINAMKSHARYL